MEYEPAPSIASSFADSVSTGVPSFAVNSSRKRRRMRAWMFSNASRYTYEIAAETPSISAHDWLKKWIEDTGKSIGVAVAENEDAAYTIVHIAPDGIVLDKGRTGAVYSTPADLVLQVGDKVVVSNKAELRLPRIWERDKDEPNR